MLRLAPLFLVLLVTFGCGASSTVTYMSENLQDDLETKNVAILSTSMEQGKVQLVMRNTEDKPYRVESRCSFIGHDGSIVDGPTSWRVIFIGPNGIAKSEFLSKRPADEIDDYYIEVREIK